MCFPPPAPLWNATSFLLLRPPFVSLLPPVERDILPAPAALVQFIYNYIGITICVSPLPPPCGTRHPSFSCGRLSFPPFPPVERDILPFPAALVQFIYNYIGITICVSPLPPPCGTRHPSFSSFASPLPPVERDILPFPAALVQLKYNYIGITICVSPLPPPCGTRHPSFSSFISPLPPPWNGTSFLFLRPWFS